MAKGYKQRHGIDYEEVYAHVAHMETIRLLIYLAQMKWNINKLDVKSTFLKEYLKEEDNVDQPLGFVVKKI